MKLDASTELQIRRYLLGSLSDEELEQVETRLMTDDDFFRQINLIEDDLVEEYLDQDLGAEERRRFEETFLCAPERQHKLRFTKALRVRAAQASEPGTLLKAPVKQLWWQPVFALFDLSRPVLIYSLATALVVVSFVGYRMKVEMSGLRVRIASLEAQRQDREAAENGLREQIRKAKDQIAGLQQQQSLQLPAGLAPGNQSFALVDQPSITLSPGALRSAQSLQECKVPESAVLVLLKLDLAEDRGNAYKAVLLTDSEKEILTRSNLKADVSEREITVGLRVPASDMPPGNYFVRLYVSDEKEYLESYTFRVTRK